jgi:hypothetical protein
VKNLNQGEQIKLLWAALLIVFAVALMGWFKPNVATKPTPLFHEGDIIVESYGSCYYDYFMLTKDFYDTRTFMQVFNKEAVKIMGKKVRIRIEPLYSNYPTDEHYVNLSRTKIFNY